MSRIGPMPGFDWSRLTWGRPDSRPSALCSYCHAAIVKEVPLILLNDAGDAVRFCEACCVTWWGMSPATSAGEEDLDG